MAASLVGCGSVLTLALPVQILRTATPDAAPAAGSLLPGALAVEMASAAPRLWVGVDPALSYTGNMRLVVDSSATLPIRGGELTEITTTAATSGIGLTITNNDTSGTRHAITVTGSRGAYRFANQTNLSQIWQLRVNNDQPQILDYNGSRFFGITRGSAGIVAIGPLTNPGVSSVAIGAWACQSTVNPPDSTTAVGALALYAVTGTVNNRNAAFGYDALGRLTTGASNTAFGSEAGRFHGGGVYSLDVLTNHVTQASFSIFIGNQARPDNDNQTNQIVIGRQAIGNGSNTITFGNVAVLSLHTVAGLSIGDGGGSTVNWPAGGTRGAMGQGTINCRNGIYVNGIFVISGSADANFASVTVGTGGGTALNISGAIQLDAVAIASLKTALGI